MVLMALWTLVVVATGSFVACLLDDVLDPKEDEIPGTPRGLGQEGRPL